MASPEQDADRAAFEKWCKDEYSDDIERYVESGEYLERHVHGAWEGWQAHARASGQPALEQVEALHRETERLLTGNFQSDLDQCLLLENHVRDLDAALRALAAPAQAQASDRHESPPVDDVAACDNAIAHCTNMHFGTHEEAFKRGFISGVNHARASASPVPAKARKALEQIARWDGFPDTGRFWDVPDNTEPMFYRACFGSNGEREFMREIARKALASLPAHTGGEKT